MDKKIVIVGAGPAGMAAAMELNKAKQPFMLIEKNNHVGGLAITYIYLEGDLEFRTDNGPHRFFSKNQYLYDFIKNLLDEKWRLVERHTQQFIRGKYYDYPINAIQVVKNLGLWTVTKAFLDYVAARVEYGLFKKPLNNFFDYAVANFGKTLANLNIINYTEKIWGVSTKNLHPDWAKQRITGLNLRTLVKNTLKKLFSGGRQTDVKTLVDAFYYPEHGTGLIYETIRAAIEADGNEVMMTSYPTKIYYQDSKIKSLDLQTPSGLRNLPVDFLIESIHIVDFIKLLDPLPPVEIVKAADNLHYRHQVHLFITLNRERISRNQWIYFPEKDIPFARISEMKNFSDRMSPPGKTSLFVEFFCHPTDEIYNYDKDKLFELALPYFEKYGFFSRAEVRNYYLIKGGKDYPIYDLTYLDNLKIVKDYLDKFENLYYIGRPGRFKYTNQDHSLEMGIMAAKSILDGRKIDIEDVGAEKEYFEKGSVK